MLEFYIQSIIEWLTAPDILGQEILMVSGILLAWLSSIFIKKFIFNALESKINFSGKLTLIIENLRVFIFPSLCFLFLAIGTIIAQRMLGEMALMAFATHCSVLVIVLRAVNTLSPSPAIKSLIVISMISSLILSHFNLLEPTFYYLDAVGFTLGKNKISAYKILKTLIIISMIIWISRLISRRGESYIRGIRSVNVDTREWLVKIFEIGLYFISTLIVLDLAGVDLAALALFGGALGVGLGFGLQKIASNFISGLILLFEKTIQVNDLVELEGSILGFVKRLEVQNILVEALDGREILVPNEEFIIKRVTNWTYSNTRARLEVKLTVPFGSDLDQVRELMLNAAKEHPLVLQYPQSLCFVRNFENNAVEMLLFFWIADIKKGILSVRSEVMLSIWRRFRDAKIEFGYPKSEVMIHSKFSDDKLIEELCLPS